MLVAGVPMMFFLKDSSMSLLGSVSRRKTIIAISPHCVAALETIMPDMSFHAGGRGCPCFDTANYMQLAKGTGAP